eukprot:scaffold3.g6679.t1
MVRHAPTLVPGPEQGSRVASVVLALVHVAHQLKAVLDTFAPECGPDATRLFQRLRDSTHLIHAAMLESMFSNSRPLDKAIEGAMRRAERTLGQARDALYRQLLESGGERLASRDEVPGLLSSARTNLREDLNDLYHYVSNETLRAVYAGQAVAGGAQLPAETVAQLAALAAVVNLACTADRAVLVSVAQLVVGSRSEKEAALSQLLYLSLTDEGRENIGRAGGIPALVGALDSELPGVVVHATAALGSIATGGAAFQEEIVATGGALLLQRLLESSNAEVSEEAGRALEALPLDTIGSGLAALASAVSGLPALSGPAYSARIEPRAEGSGGAAGAPGPAPDIPLLVDQLKSSSAAKQQDAARALARLAGGRPPNPERLHAIAAAGAIPRLVRMLDASGEGPALQAAVALGALAAGGPSYQALIAAGSGIPPLLARLSDPSLAVQQEAAATLHKVTYCSAPNMEAIASAGGLPLLVAATGSPSEAVQQHAAAVVRALCCVSPALADAVVDAGGIPALVHALGSGSLGLQRQAAAALRNLSCGGADSPNRPAIVAAGGLVLLIGLLSSESEAVQAHAAAALCNLAYSSPHNRAAITGGGGVARLVRLLGSGSEDVQQEAAGALRTLCCGSTSTKEAVAAAGGVPLLVRLLGSPVEPVQVHAVAVLRALSAVPSAAAAIEPAGGVEPLVRLLDHTNEAAYREAAATLRNMCTGDAAAAAAVAIVAAGAVPRLTLLLNVKSAGAQQQAAAALGNLAAVSGTIRAAIAGAGAIPLLVRLVNGPSEAVQQRAAATLGNLCIDSAQNMRAVSAAGGGPSLERLLQSPHEGVRQAAERALKLGWGGARLVRDINGSKWDVTVISPRNHMVFTPLLASTCVGTVETRSVTLPIVDNYFYASECSAVHHEDRTVECVSEDGVRFFVEYDALAIATGSQGSTFGIPGVEQHARFLRTAADSLERARLLHVVVVSDGELADFVNRDLMKIDPSRAHDIRITLVEASELLGSFDPHLREYAARNLVKAGVHLIKGVVRDKEIELHGSGGTLPYGLCVWSTGVGPTPFTLSLPFAKTSRGRLAVDDRLRVLAPSQMDKACGGGRGRARQASHDRLVNDLCACCSSGAPQSPVLLLLRLLQKGHVRGPEDHGAGPQELGDVSMVQEERKHEDAAGAHPVAEQQGRYLAACLNESAGELDAPEAEPFKARVAAGFSSRLNP